MRPRTPHGRQGTLRARASLVLVRRLRPDQAALDRPLDGLTAGVRSQFPIDATQMGLHRVRREIERLRYPCEGTCASEFDQDLPLSLTQFRDDARSGEDVVREVLIQMRDEFPEAGYVGTELPEQLPAHEDEIRSEQHAL